MPSGIYTSKKRRGGVKGKSGIYKRTPQALKNLSKAAKQRYINNGPTNFKGDNVCYNAFHLWIVRDYGKPTNCNTCIIYCKGLPLK